MYQVHTHTHTRTHKHRHGTHTHKETYTHTHSFTHTHAHTHTHIGCVVSGALPHSQVLARGGLAALSISLKLAYPSSFAVGWGK